MTVIRVGVGQTKSGKILDSSTRWFELKDAEEAIRYAQDMNTVYNVLQVITAPIWILLFIICIPFMAYDVGDPAEDERWCKLHGYTYPYGLGWGCHKQVKKWQKEYKEQHKIEFKTKIRKRIKNHNFE